MFITPYKHFFYSLHLLIAATSKFIWAFIKLKRVGVVRTLSLPSTVHNFCPQTSVNIWSLTILIDCLRIRAHEWAKNGWRYAFSGRIKSLVSLCTSLWFCLPQSVALASRFVVFTEMGATGWRDWLRRRVGGQYESGK